MKKPNEIKDYEIRKVFTDRNEPISEFQRWYKRANDNQDDFFVLSFYGKGGIGKSSLINQLCRDLAGKSGFFVKYDIEYTKGLDQYNILLGIKQSIRNRYGDLFHFPLYNFALIILAKKTDVIFKNDEVIKSIVEESPHLQIVLNTISLIPLVGGFIQNVSEIYAMICADIDNLKIHMTLKEKYKRYIDEMLKLEGDELRKKMPVYFAADMSENTEKLQKPFGDCDIDDDGSAETMGHDCILFSFGKHGCTYKKFLPSIWERSLQYTPCSCI